MGDVLEEKPDFDKRSLVRKNHSATHLLQKALQDIVSKEIHQEGAYYDEEGLHFDFNSDEKLTEDQLNAVEKKVNEWIFASYPVTCKIMAKDEAMKLSAMHLFSDKYGEKVRVVTMGPSVEFCGGLHVSNTSEINLFVLVSEGAVSAGIRRIVAYTGMKAYEYLKEKQSMINEAASILKLNSDKGVRQKLFSLNEQIVELNSEIKSLREQTTNALMDELFEKTQNNVLVALVKNLNHEQEDSIAHKLIDKNPDLVLLLAIDNGEKNDLVIAVGRNRIALNKAGVLMKEISKTLNGRGGGRPDCAFGGTNDLSQFEKAKIQFISLVK